MKKLFAILACCLLVVSASAAGKTTTVKKSSSKSSALITKGQWFFAPSLTNVGLNSISIKPEGASSSTNVTRFGLQGTGGYGLQENLAIEAGAGFESLNVDGSASSVFDIFAGARYYFYNNFFANADLLLAYGETGESSYEGKFNSFGLNIGAGYDFMISNNFAFEPSISYTFSLAAQFEEAKFNLGLFSVNLGFVYFF